MSDTDSLSFDLQEVEALAFDLSDGDSLSFTLTTPIEPEEYEGSYHVVPSLVNQTLETNGFKMTDDVTIDAILPLKRGVIRPDAEWLKSWTHDSYAVEDDKKTLPAYSTSAQTIVASANLSGTIDLDYDNYDYYVVERFLTTPVYNTDTPAKSRNEYGTGVVLYELLDVPANTFKSANGTVYTSRVVGAVAGTCYRLLYWSSATALSVYTATSYGVAQIPNAPSVSSGKWTIKAPTLQMRGSTSYLTSAVWGTITDIRRQFSIDVYRAPKGNLSLDAWGLNQETWSILNDVNNNNGKLR